MTIELLRTIVHYGLHFGAPFLLCFLWPKDKRLTAALFMLAVIVIDLDHLFATPLFDPNRCSIGFHPLHSYIAIAIYVIACILPYERMKLSWKYRPVAVGLVTHILTDVQDFYLWKYVIFAV